jgi:hypothetical protein
MYATNKSNKKDLVQSKKDLELFIESSSLTEVKGKIQLSYLNENFEGRIIATPYLIKLKTIHPFQGMVAAVAVEAEETIRFLQTNGGLSASGQQ